MICFDSRKVRKGDTFVAIKGLHSDGHDYIKQVIEKGAAHIIYENEQNLASLKAENPKITFQKTPNSAETLAHLASDYYGNPSEKLKLIGITGTNGKTTSVSLLYDLFRKLGYKVGLISTIENKIDTEIIPSKYTTPDTLELNKLLAQMLEKGCQFVFMEVSSHAIEQHRITGLTFAGGIFSNISHEHLDYHKTFDGYIKAKKKFFDHLPKTAFALVNTDDRRGNVMLQNTKATRYSYALKSMADFKARLLECSFQGLQLEINNQEVWFRLIGDFNAYNLLSVYATAVLLGENETTVLTHLSGIQPAKGRFEQLRLKNNVSVIIDYAHTPDALENVLKTINIIRKNKQHLITVIGCGGDRDAEKRPLMAKIAYKESNLLIITSDNPRNEEPQEIIDDMIGGLSKEEEALKTKIIVDRKQAILEAVKLAKPHDIILIAGKGHEDYQEIKGIRHHFSDKEIVINA